MYGEIDFLGKCPWVMEHTFCSYKYSIVLPTPVVYLFGILCCFPMLLLISGEGGVFFCNICYANFLNGKIKIPLLYVLNMLKYVLENFDSFFSMVQRS